MVEIFPSMMKTTNPQIQKSQQTSSRRNMKTSTYLTSGSTTKPQSSRQYGTGTKTDV